MPAKPPPTPFHPRNRHQGRYDFTGLITACPQLREHVIEKVSGEPSIDFADPAAVLIFNRALLRFQYGIEHWNIPAGYLCPAIPGRADYLHGLADLLAAGNAGVVPRGLGVRVLDIGVGANCVYPMLGSCEYGWQFVGSEVDPEALKSAQAIVDANPSLRSAVELRWQAQRGQIFAGLIQAGERFELSMCNPPFHASAAEAAAASQRKWRNLGKTAANSSAPALNFGGQDAELWCTGGEASFLKRMLKESVQYGRQVAWFSTLVSKSGRLADLYKQLDKLKVLEVRTGEMAQGQKQSRWVAWRFF